MKRQFALPIVIAALLHAGLLLGLRGHPAETPVAMSKPPVPAKPESPKIEMAPPPETDAEATAPAKGMPSEAPPVLDEHPALPRPDGFPIEIPRREVSQHDNITVIPPGAVGLSGGNPIGVGDFGGTIVRAVDLDGVPRARYQSQPVYPAEARSAGLAGEVLVEFLVDETGVVREVRAVRSSNRVFEESALRAVAHWRFEPGRRHGSIVRFRMAVPIVFTLAEN